MSQTICDACRESTSGYCYAHSTRYVPLATPNPQIGSNVPVLSPAMVRAVIDYGEALRAVRALSGDGTPERFYHGPGGRVTAAGDALDAALLAEEDSHAD